MNDIFSREQTTRLFAVIAAGGTAGALTGPIITTQLVESVGLSYLLLISALILSLTLFCIYQLSMHAADISSDGETNIQEKGALKGGVLDGIKFTFSSPYLRMIACFVIVFAVISTFLSIQLAETIEAVFSDSEQRTKLFSQADLITNVLTLLFQLSITGKLIRWLGYRNTLLLLPVGLTIGFVLVGFSPIFLSLIALSVFSRAGKYAILNPTSEMLFSVLSREEKYKAKNFIDTTIVRSSNVLSSWLFAGVKALGAGAAGVAVLGASLGIAWCLISYWLGNKYQLESTQKPYLVKEEK
jgi:AAA family ATP:ADP antiporter